MIKGLDKNQKKLFFAFLFFLFLMEVLYTSLYYLPKSPNLLYKKYLLTSFSCYIIYFFIIHLINKLTFISNKFLLIIIFSSGIIFRLTLINLPPFLSDDIYRYIWDGYLQAKNINPYLYPPNSLELTKFRNTDIFPFINHPNLQTIYPPISQIIFFFSYLIGKNSFLTIKLIILLFDIGTGLFIAKILYKLELPLTKVSIYFLCPLPILEFFISGHIDSIGIFFLVLFIFCSLNNKYYFAAFSLANSILIKIMPIIFLPLILYKTKRFQFLICFSFILLLFYLPHYIVVKENIFGSFNTFIKDFYFNSSIFSLIYNLTKDSKLSIYLCYLVLSLWILIGAIKSHNFIKGIFWTLTGLYIFSPIVHPWYLTWVVPFLVFIPSKAFFWLISSIQLSYCVLISYKEKNIWEDSITIRLIEYLPFFALLSYDLLRLKTLHFQEQTNDNRKKS
jgi:hypothetical protein